MEINLKRRKAVDTFEGFYAYVEFGGYVVPEEGEGLEVVEKFKAFGADGWQKGGGTAYLLKVWIASLDKSEGRVRFMPGTTENLRSSHEGGLDHVLPNTDEVRQAWLAERRANFAEDQANHEAAQVRQAAREVLEAFRIKADEYEAGKPPVVDEPVIDLGARRKTENATYKRELRRAAKFL